MFSDLRPAPAFHALEVISVDTQTTASVSALFGHSVSAPTVFDSACLSPSRLHEMVESKIVSVMKLDNTNYHLWKFKVRMLLIREVSE